MNNKAKPGNLDQPIHYHPPKINPPQRLIVQDEKQPRVQKTYLPEFNNGNQHRQQITNL